MKRSSPKKPPHPTRPQPPAALGAIEGLYGNTLQGWAYDSGDPEQRLVVEIYVDDAFVTITRADKEQPVGATGDGFHGFWVQLPNVFTKNAKKVSVRIANQGPWLAGSISLPQVQTNALQVTKPSLSQVYYSGGLRFNGWAFDPAQPHKELTLRARVGDQIVSTTPANRPHPALVYTKDPDHGFELDLPWALADGQPHLVHIETAAGQSLVGSPITVCFRPEGTTALLRTLWPDTHSQHPAQAILLGLTEEQNRRFPSSCGFLHYPAWFDLFQQAEPPAATAGKVTLLLLGSGSAIDLQASLNSIAQQRLPASQINVVSLQEHNLVSAIKAHLSDTALFVPLQVGDRLPPHALDTLLQEISTTEAEWGYADCDQDDANGQRGNPWFKPAWDETLFQSMDYITPGSAFTRQAMQNALNIVNPQADWPALLEAIAQTTTGRVVHIPRVLYHRHARGEAHPQRRTPQWPTPGQWPGVSLIVPTRDQLDYLKPCIDGLLDDTDYPDLEIIVVNNDSHEPETLSYLKKIQQRGVKVLDYPKAFNYAAINNWAVGQAKGTVIGLINNDIKVIEPNWLKTMVTQLSRPNVGAVGAKLLWPNGMVQHGGVVVGINQLAAHSGNKGYKDDAGYLGFNQVAREQSAVTAACLLMTKADFEALKGFDADQFPIAFNDVDLCLRLRQTGKRIVWTPDAMLIHAESASRGKEDSPSKAQRAHREQSNFIRQWAHLIATDPYYHPALSQDFANGPYAALACPPPPLTPRVSKPAPEGQIGVR